jgi:hypothetical protein
MLRRGRRLHPDGAPPAVARGQRPWRAKYWACRGRRPVASAGGSRSVYWMSAEKRRLPPKIGVRED